MTDATDPPAARNGRPVRFWLTLAVLAAGVFVYVLLITTPTGGPKGTEGPAIGRRLGYLRLEGLTGEAGEVSLDDLEGRVTLLNYWGTWCPPCLREFPEIVELDERFGGRDDFRLYAVSCGQRDDPTLDELRDETESFLASRRFTLPTYADPNGASRKAMVLVLGLGEMAYPTTLVFDRQGVIRGFWPGYHPRAAREMAELIEQLLAAPHEKGDAATQGVSVPSRVSPCVPCSAMLTVCSRLRDHARPIVSVMPRLCPFPLPIPDVPFCASRLPRERLDDLGNLAARIAQRIGVHEDKHGRLFPERARKDVGVGRPAVVGVPKIVAQGHSLPLAKFRPAEGHLLREARR
ncbi:MAG: TlpA disulfide reductase family protein [Pirellulales bacterium]